jgi:3-methyladenine DNA glycosylase AlkD
VTRASSLLRRVRAELVEAADPKRAPAMQAYMKSAMPYHGVSAVPMRAVWRALFAEVRFADEDAWQAAVLDLWRNATHREERYAAIALSGHRAARAFQTPAAMPMYEEMIVTGAWWDFVDGIASDRVGGVLASHPGKLKRMMRVWSRSSDMWKRRTSIISQLRFKEATDLELLYACIEPSLASKEFFLRKAIGWALRQLAWTMPDEVERYVREHDAELSGLSKREALKNVGSGRRDGRRS